MSHTMDTCFSPECHKSSKDLSIHNVTNETQSTSIKCPEIHLNLLSSTDKAECCHFGNVMYNTYLTFIHVKFEGEISSLNITNLHLCDITNL